ncbi:MAG: fused MFS/spermidine synthase [Hyphomicrobiales bacterium]|nr:fused MFS/spermidine synthase [Hyphomicrobiales bacterium]
MTIFDVASTAAVRPAALRLAPALYATTLFLAALLLFMVQPMFTKMVLPQLGGAPTVWSVAMVFFQAALLAGYAYAHVLVRGLPLGQGALVHLVMLAAAALTLPITVSTALGPPPSSNIAVWLIGLLAVSVGLPFAVLSASAPLLQGWFAASGHPHARNPYVLYAASNLGSFAALVAYPIIVEPLLPLKVQAALWAVGFAAVAALVASAALFVARRPDVGCGDVTAPPVTTWDRLAWVALAAVPSGLCVGVTSYITTDVAAAPFLWVVPLGLYLLTFVAVFRDRPWISRASVTLLLPILMAPLSVGLLGGERIFWLPMIVLNLAVFLLMALLCHGALYDRRPDPARLTEFYLWVAFGGVIGGAFAALLAPLLFNGIYEYPLLLLAGLLALPGMLEGGRRRWLDQAGPILALAALMVVAQRVLDIRLPLAAGPFFEIALVLLVGAMMWQRHQPVRFLALVVLAFVLTGLWRPGLNVVEASRSFFGVHQVVETADQRHRLLFHGTTLHGAARIDGGSAAEPLTYYHSEGPIAESIAAVRSARGGLGRVGVVGLGAGSLACHSRPQEQWTFFEIDAAVVEIARNPRLFKFVSTCKPDLSIVLGDARLTLASAAVKFDLIVLDAFSSDAIPVHLLTREAIAGYLDRLEPNGALVIHISNRHMELARVVAAAADANGALTWLKDDRRPVSLEDLKTRALVAVMARRPADVGPLPQLDGWHEIAPDPRVSLWTDDYSNILGAILRKKLGW